MDDSDFAFGRSCAQIDDDSTTGGVGFSGYSDFHTIDWQRDLARDRMRHRHISKKRGNSIWELVKVSFHVLDAIKVRVYSYDVAFCCIVCKIILFNEQFYHSLLFNCESL